MKYSTMRLMGFVGAIIASMMAAGAFGAYTDGLLWSFSAQQGEADGTFDASKFVDAVSAGSANPFALTFNYDDAAARPYFTNVTVRSTLQGKSVTRTCLYLPQPAAGVSGTYKLANATVPHDKLSTGEVTFFIRYSWEGRLASSVDDIEIYDNAWDYSSSKGWDLWFTQGDNTWAHPYSICGPYSGSRFRADASYLYYNKIDGRDWIDFAVTLSNGADGKKVCTFYQCNANASAISSWSFTATVDGNVPGPTSGRSGRLFGQYGETISTAGGNKPGNFRGTIADVKLWNRALSAEEIELAFRDAAAPLILENENLVLNADRTVSSVSITGNCTISGSGKLIINTADGITVNGGTANIECPVQFDAGSATVSVIVDSTSKLVQTGVWSGSSPIKLVGAGYSDFATHSFELRGANIFTGALSFDRAKVYLYGGASVGAADGATSWTVSAGSSGSLVYFMGGTFADNFTASGSNNYKGWWQSVRFAENCTNIFTGTVNFGQPAYYVAEAGSRTFFKGTVNGYSDYNPTLIAGSEITFDTNSVYNGAAFYPSGSGTVNLHSVRSGGTGDKNEYRVEAGVMWRLYGENLISGTAARGGVVNGTVDLNGFNQAAGACRGGDATGVVTSQSAATWTVDQSNFANIENANTFAGAVNLRKIGSNNLRLLGSSTTTGSLLIDAGTVTLASSAAWAGPVEVASGAAVSFDGDRTLAEGDRIALANGGSIALGGQLFASEGQITLAGTPVPAGKYTKDTSGYAFVSGDGSVTVTAAMGDPIVVESNMTINEDVLVPSVTFKGPYTISGSGSITVLGGKVTIENGDDSTDEYVMNVPLTLSGNIVGSGYLSFAKGVSFLEPTFVTNTNLRVCGTLDIAKGLTFVQTPAANNRAELILANAQVSAGSSAIVLATENTYYALRAEEGTTNVVTCGTLNGSTGNSRFFFDRKSLTTFNCSLAGLQYFCPAGTGEAVYNGKVSGWNLSLGGGTMHLTAADNRFAFDGSSAPLYATQVSVALGAKLLLDTANALSDRRNEVNVAGEIELSASQSVGPLVGDGRITSVTAATWDFEQRSFTSETPKVEGPTSNTVVFADSLNVRKSGSNAVYFGGISTSTGELEVAEGTVGFYGKGCWQSCAAIRVSAGARLVLDRRRIDKKTTSIYLEPGAKVLVPGGVNAGCAALYLNGVRQDPGCYTKANCPDYIEGDGNLWAERSPGIIMVVR